MKKLRITIGKKTYDVSVEVLDDGSPNVHHPRHVHPVASTSTGSAPMPDATTKPTASPALAGLVVAPMAGVIKSIAVKQGDEVKQGMELAVLEAMKMENKIVSPTSGTVKSIEVSQGQAVTEGQTVVVLES